MKREIFRILLEIPKGKVVTYADIARAAGTSPRAAGQILKRNPCPDKYPCYRVVMSSGKVGGYLGNDARKKESLLREEGIEIRKGKIDLSRFGFVMKKKLKNHS